MRNIDKLDRAIMLLKQDPAREITEVTIEGYSSPEGSAARNEELSLQRAETVKNYLTDRINLPDSLIRIVAGGVAWGELEHIIKNRKSPEASQVELIINSTPATSRNQQIEKIDNGELYQYIFENIYPRLRYSNVTIISHRLEAILTPASPSQPTNEISQDNQAVTSIIEWQSTASLTPLFAIKTNLLFDLATLVNLEVEIPIKQRWSLCAEFIFPWWTMNNGLENSKRNRVQLRNGNLEIRRWCKSADTPILTGWFYGAYTGAGSYDFEWRAKGYQGEWFVGAGLSGGYAHTINQAENLRLEYSLGVGYFETEYKYYHAEFCNNSCWHAIEQRSGKHIWIGPSRAKISLSWLINRRK